MGKKQDEARFRTRAMRRINEIPNSLVERIEDPGKRAILDSFGHVGGFAIWLEFKSEDGVPSRLQIKKVYDISTTGGIALFIYPDNFEEVFSDLRSLQSVTEYVRLQSKYSEKAQELYAEMKDLSQSKMIPFGHDESL